MKCPSMIACEQHQLDNFACPLPINQAGCIHWNGRVLGLWQIFEPDDDSYPVDLDYIERSV